MPRRRLIERMTEAERLSYLLTCLAGGVSAVAAGGRRTDAVGVACNLGRPAGVRRADFDGLMGRTLADSVTRAVGDAYCRRRGRPQQSELRGESGDVSGL